MIPFATPVVRRLATAAGALAAFGAATVLLAAPAFAEPAEGWPPTEPVSAQHVLLLLVGIPALMFVVISVLTYLPALIRGERIKPGGPSVEDQWLGGPRAAGELSAPDGETSSVGGASGRW